jgi:hypothetical protein
VAFDYRIAVSIHNAQEKVSWKGYSDAEIPRTISSQLPSSIPVTFLFDTTIDQSTQFITKDLLSVVKQVHGTWQSILGKTLSRGHKHYVQFRIDKVDTNGYIMLGFWYNDPDKLSLATTQHLGQGNTNGGFGFYLHGNHTVYYGDGRSSLVLPDLNMLAPFQGRHVGLLLDLNVTSDSYRSISLFLSSDDNEATLEYRGILISHLPVDFDYRIAVSIHNAQEKVSWKGYSDGDIPVWLIH